MLINYNVGRYRSIVDIEIIEEGMLDSKVFVFEGSLCFFKSDHAWEVISKTRASCFIGVSKHLKTIKALGLRPRAFICFSVFGYPDETLALILEIVHAVDKCDQKVL